MDDEVGTLLQLKKSFKSLTNQEWKPGVTLEQLGFQSVPAPAPVAPSSSSSSSDKLTVAAIILDDIKQQGDRIRQLKSEKREKVGDLCLLKYPISRYD